MEEIGDHSLLADGRTAALVDGHGNVAWLCWPRVDSSPCLLAIVDPARGGEWSLRPATPRRRVSGRRYWPGTLVLETTWDTDEGEVMVVEALAWDGPPRLVRTVTGRVGRVEMRSVFRPAFDAARCLAHLALDGNRCVASGGGIHLAVVAPGTWVAAPDAAAETSVTVSEGETAGFALAGPADALDEPPEAVVERTARAWLSRTSAAQPSISPLAARALGERTASELVLQSAAVLIGLHQRGGGIVAAPTTSLPQWPGSTRTWDYRYCWLRDASLAALALSRLGLTGEAQALGTFIGSVALDEGAQPLVRIDGSTAPPEVELPHLAGHGGARPVRIGNAAAGQAQLDVVGEVIELAHELARTGPLPEPLRRAVPRLADWTVDNWERPDHGIWEIRGEPRRYTHSRLLAWFGLRSAADLRGRGLVEGAGGRWSATAAQITDAILRSRPGPPGPPRGLPAELEPPSGAGGAGRSAEPPLAGHVAPRALELRADGGGADASLALVPLLGFLPPDDPRVRATLDLITSRLERGGFIDRYEGQPDQIGDACAPFLFPTFWTAAALDLAEGDGAALLARAAAARGATGLFGEVADPDTGTPLGNYPQVQSHAAFILAATRAVSSW